MVPLQRVRALIQQGHSDAEIEDVLRSESEWDGDWQKPGNFLRALSATMGNATETGHAVDVREVQQMMTQLRRMWEHAHPNFERSIVDPYATKILGRSGQKVAESRFLNALADLENDMQVLGLRPGSSSPGTAREQERMETVARYSEQISGHSFISVAQVGKAIADCMLFIYQSFPAGTPDPVVASIPGELLPLVVVHRPRWQDMIADHVQDEAPAPR